MTYPASLDELTDGVPADGAAATTELDDATYPHDDHHRELAATVEGLQSVLGYGGTLPGNILIPPDGSVGVAVAGNTDMGLFSCTDSDPAGGIWLTSDNTFTPGGSWVGIEEDSGIVSVNSPPGFLLGSTTELYGGADPTDGSSYGNRDYNDARYYQQSLDLATQVELDAEAALARNADNLTSGTVADARIASTIARDSEVSSAISTSESGQVRDGDTAGGVLSGTYPNPGFAADMATQAELDAEATLARNGDNITSGTVADARIASTIARDSEVAAAYQPLAADLTDIAAIADAQGDIIVRGASGWERLAKSATSTHVLTAGASQPAWSAPAGGGLTIMLPKTTGGTQAAGIPGVGTRAITAAAIVINRDYFAPLIVSNALTITKVQLEVTTGPASDATIYLGIFAANADMQPTGAALLNTTITCATASTGVKSASSLSVALPAGNYVSIFNTNVTFSARYLQPSFPVANNASMGTSMWVGQTYGSRTAGAYGTNPAGFDTLNMDSTPYCWLIYQWTTP